jgi:hypothetical protein
MITVELGKDRGSGLLGLGEVNGTVTIGIECPNGVRSASLRQNWRSRTAQHCNRERLQN